MTPRLTLLGLLLFVAAPEARGQAPTLPQSTGVDAQGDPLPAGARARLGSTRFRVGGNIAAAALSPDGKWIASTNNVDTVTLTDPTTGKEIRRFRLPGGYGASFVTFAPDGKRLAVLGYSSFVQVVDIPSGKLVSKLQAPQPNNNRLSGVAFSGDGSILVAGTDNFGQNKNVVHAWEVASGKALHNFEVVQNSQIRGVLSRDGGLLATSGFYSPRNGMENNPDQGRTIQLWDVKTGQELRKVKIDRNQVMAVALSPDAKTFAVASGAATFHLFETATGKELRRFAGRRGQTQLLQFAPDGQVLVAGLADGTVQMWEAGTGKRLGLTDGPRQRLFSLAFPGPGQVWALGLEGQSLALWNAATGQALSPKDGHMTWVRLLAYAPDGKTLLTGGADGKLCWWDTGTARELRHYLIRDDDAYRYGGYLPGTRNSSYALSHDGKYLAAASDFGNNTIRLYEMPGGKVLCDFDAPRTNSPAGFAFAPDNTRLAALGLHGVHLWDVTTGQELPTLPFKADRGNNNGISGGGIVFSPDGKVLAAARSYYDRNTGIPYGEVYLWHNDSGAPIACIEQSGQNAGTMAFSPNSQLLALPMQNQGVMLVKATTGRELGRLEGSPGQFTQGLAFSPDGRLVAGAQQSTFVYAPVDSSVPAQAPTNRIVVWELASGQVRQEFTGHHGTVACLAFAPDGRTLATGSADSTVVLWDLSGKRSGTVGTPPTAKIAAAWDELGGKNGKVVYNDLMTALIGNPEATVELLRQRLKPAAGIKANPADIDRLIGELDNEKFAVRVKATSALEHLGDLAGASLRKAMLAQTSLEAQRRLKSLLERLDQAILATDDVRLVRAVEVLEKIGTPQARDLLQALATGAPQARLTSEAQSALLRLPAN